MSLHQSTAGLRAKIGVESLSFTMSHSMSTQECDIATIGCFYAGTFQIRVASALLRVMVSGWLLCRLSADLSTSRLLEVPHSMRSSSHGLWVEARCNVCLLILSSSYGIVPLGRPHGMSVIS